MGETVDSRNTLRQNDAMRQRPALEALLHAAMFEEKLGMQAQSMFANIEDDQYNRLYGEEDRMIMCASDYEASATYKILGCGE